MRKSKKIIEDYFTNTNEDSGEGDDGKGLWNFEEKKSEHDAVS